MNKMNVLNIFLLIVVMVSAFSVVSLQNQYRVNFIALDKAKKQEIRLNEDYAQLRLQQAKLANHKLIKVVAEKQNLRPPAATNTVMIEQKR